MYKNICSSSSRISTISLSLIIAFLCSSCVRGVFQPVSVGREYGDPVPIMVSHLGKSGPHYFLQNVVCFDYLCRKGIGKRRAMKAISFDDFKKRIAKNAKKGMYKKATVTPRVVKPDTTRIPKKPERKVDTVALPIVVPVPDVAAPILKADSLIILSELLFELNSYRLKGAHFSALDSLGKFLKAHPTLVVKVSGHTDSTGTERHNVQLSLRRAETVAEYLIDKGAPFDQVSYEGFGSARPIRGNETEEGRSKNRRVEILIRNPVKK